MLFDELQVPRSGLIFVVGFAVCEGDAQANVEIADVDGAGEVFDQRPGGKKERPRMPLQVLMASRDQLLNGSRRAVVQRKIDVVDKGQVSGLSHEQAVPVSRQVSASRQSIQRRMRVILSALPGRCKPVVPVSVVG